MKERPIIFSGPMVLAILEGRKTQTRRVVKPQLGALEHFKRFVFEKHPFSPSCFVGTPAEGRISGAERMGWIGEDAWGNAILANEADWIHCPYGVPGDRLWVRETWSQPGGVLRYRADGESKDVWKWAPSLYMPRSASRITLEITGVRVERLQEISEEDAKAEGIEPSKFVHKAYQVPGESMVHYVGTAKEAFECLWESIHGPGSWDANPWVWVIDFKRNDKLTRDTGTQKL